MQKKYIFHHLLHLQWMMVALCIVASSCSDEFQGYTELTSPVDCSEMYWNTHTRTAAEEQTMLRSHGVGFSFDAINGERCDVGSVRCQIVNLEALEEAGAYDCSYEGHSQIKNNTSRSFAEYNHNVNIGASVSGDVLIYKGSYQKVASIFEHALDTTICFTTEMSEDAVEKTIDTNMLELLLESEPEQYLSDNFLYAIDKLKRNGKDNIAVVDSFINIFGTHVITNASVGGKLQLDVISDRKAVTTLAMEKEVKEQSLKLFFKEKVETMTEEELKAVTTLLENSEIHLSAVGGDLSKLNTLIANPSYSNTAATPDALYKWQESIDFDETDPWNNRCEMTDMDVTPIWEFIPDKDVAAVVESRIIATAPTMQELYGNRNFINVEIPILPGMVSTNFAGTTKIIDNPWVTDVIAAHRHVATICKEWVPEITPDNSVYVVYPIYENRIQMDAGLCVYNGISYRVKWIYNRFEVEKDTTKVNTDKVYLTFGYLSSEKTNGADYTQGTLRIGYEWPGSIAVNGSIANKQDICTTRKFLGDFYLDTDKKYINLPNWTFITSSEENKYYKDTYPELFKKDLPYELSGIKLDGKTGLDNLSNRMVRNSDYVYYINTTETGL